MFATIAQRLRDYRERRIAASHLSRMDRRELSDIGIARHDIDLVVCSSSAALVPPNPASRKGRRVFSFQDGAFVGAALRP
jgi:uncharacterized protein YjiS (DUF1127 family)